MSETQTRPLPDRPAPGPTLGPPYAGPPANPWSAPPPRPPQPHAGPGERPAGGGRRGPGWPGVAVASLLAALVASGATLTGAQVLGDDTAAPPVGTATSAPAGPAVAGDASSPDWTSVAAAVAPSVVAIQVTSPSGSGQGSGVVLDADGSVLTNNHVVAGAGAGAEVDVVLSDGRVFSGVTVVGTDPATDLAVLRIEDAPDDLVPATLGSSQDVVVGQEVMAVGNPLGLSDTVTTGIVSATDRPVTTQAEQAPQSPFGGQTRARSEAVVTNAIQTDAAINPGNSGGALVDTSGAVIGINSSIATTSAQSGSIGIGFAIPVDEAKRIAQELLADGTADHAVLGVSLQDGSATADGVTRQGARVAEVVPGSAADAGGLRPGDTVVAVDGDGVTGAESLTAHVRQRAPGSTVTLTVVRDGATLDVPAVLGTRDD